MCVSGYKIAVLADIIIKRLFAARELLWKKLNKTVKF